MEWASFPVEKVSEEVIHYMLDLIDRINYAYLKVDGTYGSLHHVVSDKVKLIERTLYTNMEQERRPNELE